MITINNSIWFNSLDIAEKWIHEQENNPEKLHVLKHESYKDGNIEEKGEDLTCAIGVPEW